MKFYFTCLLFLPTNIEHYAYLSAKTPEDDYKMGRLISNVVEDFSSDQCVSFYYQMNGKHIKYLDFFIKTTEKDLFFTYWSRKDHQGNRWRKGAFTIPKQPESYEVRHFNSVSV